MPTNGTATAGNTAGSASKRTPTSHEKTLSRAQIKAMALIQQTSEEPVIEIAHSSCESDDDAIIIEERPITEIINNKGFTASKNSPVKKDLTFDSGQQEFMLPYEEFEDILPYQRQGKDSLDQNQLSLVMNQIGAECNQQYAVVSNMSPLPPQTDSHVFRPPELNFSDLQSSQKTRRLEKK